MKQLVQDYTGGMNSVTIPGLTDLARLLLVTRTDSREILYNFADPNTAVTLSSGGLVTFASNPGDLTGVSLQIFLEDAEVGPTRDMVDALLSAVEWLKIIGNQTIPLATQDQLNRQRVAVTFEGVQPNQILDPGSVNVFSRDGQAYSVMYAVPEIWRVTDDARNNFGSTVRPLIQF